MNSFMRNTICAIVICALLLTIPFSANAIYLSDKVPDSTSEQANTRSLVFPEIYEDGNGGVEYLLFTMENLNVNKTVNTSSSASKRFYKNTLTQKNATKLYMQGLLNYTEAANTNYTNTFRAGIAYYNIDAGLPYPEYSYYPTSGRGFHVQILSVSSLDSNTQYFGFVTNLLDSGYIRGNIAFYHN